MLAEFSEVISREKFAEFSRSQVDSFLSILVRRAVLVSPALTRRIIVQDPEDDIVLGTALKGNASHIVSGDKHLLSLKKFKGLKIAAVEEMLQILGSQKYDTLHTGFNYREEEHEASRYLFGEKRRTPKRAT
jgi:predicted nucleic acid-binding protein